MLETFELIRHIAEVLGMVFLPVIGWVLVTVLNHSKKLVLLEERVNESIASKLTNLEDYLEAVESKVDKVNQLIADVHVTISGLKVIASERDDKLNSILDQLKRLSDR